jgi:hypothetical protein
MILREPQLLCGQECLAHSLRRGQESGIGGQGLHISIVSYPSTAEFSKIPSSSRLG